MVLNCKLTYRTVCDIDIEEGRGHCECLSSQDITKTVQNGAVSNQLTGDGRGGGVWGDDCESVDL